MVKSNAKLLGFLLVNTDGTDTAQCNLLTGANGGRLFLACAAGHDAVAQGSPAAAPPPSTASPGSGAAPALPPPPSLILSRFHLRPELHVQ